MRARDLRHPAQLLRPRDLREELEGVHDVLLDGDALFVGEAPARNGQHARLLWRQHAARRALGVLPGLGGEAQDLGGECLRLHARLVGDADEVQLPVQLGQRGREIGVEARGARRVVGVARERPVELGASRPQHEVALEYLHPVADAVEVGGIEFLGLHQHVLAHADLTEIVQQRGVAQLHQLVVAELELAIGTRLAAVRRLRERHREVGHAERVAGRRRIARLDRRHRRLHEALEEVPDRQIEAAVVDGDRGL